MQQCVRSRFDLGLPVLHLTRDKGILIALRARSRDGDRAVPHARRVKQTCILSSSVPSEIVLLLNFAFYLRS